MYIYFLNVNIYVSINDYLFKYIYLVSQLAQPRCDNVVTASWLTLSKRCGMVENESCDNVGLVRCDHVAV